MAGGGARHPSPHDVVDRAAEGRVVHKVAAASSSPVPEERDDGLDVLVLQVHADLVQHRLEGAEREEPPPAAVELLEVTHQGIPSRPLSRHRGTHLEIKRTRC